MSFVPNCLNNMFSFLCLLTFQMAVAIGDEATLLESLSKEVASLKNQLAVQQKRALSSVGAQVAFSSRLTHKVSGLGHGQTIIYDNEITDTNNAYNNGDGIFTPPVSGMYVFTWTLSVYDGRDLSSELRKNGVPYGYSFTDSESAADFGNVANTIVIKAQAGDHIAVVAGSFGDGVTEGANRDTFSGWLLFETE